MEKETIGDVRLDLKDKQLLFELDFDARQSVSQLAKKLRLSKQGVEYKMQRLASEGVIIGFHPIINMRKLGYIYCRLVFSLRNADFKKEQEILDYMKNESKFFWIFMMQGAYDLGAAAWVKQVKDFEKEVNELYSRFGEFIDEKNETVATDVIYFQARFLLGTEETREIHTEETTDVVEIDGLDKKILRALTKNARTPLVGLSDIVKESPKTVAYRIKKLEENGVICGYRADVDHKKLGFTWQKLWIHSSKITKELLDEIKRNPITLYIVKGVGMPGEIDVEIMVKSNQETYEFVRNLRNEFPNEIGNYKSVIMNQIEKIEYKF